MLYGNKFLFLIKLIASLLKVKWLL